ncbi:hypothetical protein A2U01_0096228, partial [Trifolium medium]|nr:hypothetical protein [Trifolium medium]
MDHEPYISKRTVGNLNDTAGGTDENHHGSAGEFDQSPRRFDSRPKPK